MVIELEAIPSEQFHLAVEGESIVFTVREALQRSRVLAMMGEVRRLIKDQFGLSPAKVENQDIFWHNAYKVKMHLAIPEVGYAVPFSFLDESPSAGWIWYRLRITQLNGQMAWLSPIWLDNGVRPS